MKTKTRCIMAVVGITIYTIMEIMVFVVLRTLINHLNDIPDTEFTSKVTFFGTLTVGILLLLGTFLIPGIIDSYADTIKETYGKLK